MKSTKVKPAATRSSAAKKALSATHDERASQIPYDIRRNTYTKDRPAGLHTSILRK